MTMEQLCQVLEGGLDRLVIDETNLEGAFVLDIHAQAPSTGRIAAGATCGARAGAVAPRAEAGASAF